MPCLTPNPATPLMCEILGAGHDSSVNPSEWQHVRTEKFALEVFLQKSVEGTAALQSPDVDPSQVNSMDELEVELTRSLSFIDEAAKSAALTALEGFGSHEAVSIAHNALAISKACPDAHTLLALYHAHDLTTALACYEAAESAALQALAVADDLVMVLSQSSVLAWTYATVRPYLRAVHGCANTLRKLGRYQESLEKYQLLMELDSHPYKNKAFVSYIAHIPEVMIALDNIAGARKFMTEHPECLDIAGACMHWVWNMALVDAIEGKVNNGLLAGFEGARSQSNIIECCLLKGYAAVIALQMTNGTIPGVLAGTEEFKCSSFPTTLGRVESEEQAAVYIAGARQLWERRPAALDALLQLRNLCHLTKWLDGDMDLPRDRATAIEYISGLEDVNVNLNQSGYRLLHVAVMSKRRHVALIRALLDAGADPNTPYNMQPLHMACYYDAPLSFLGALLAKGALVEPGEGGSVLEMAAHQGNWRPLLYLLQREPLDSQLRSQETLEALFKELVCSSCFLCVSGSGGACMRCQHDPLAHSLGCNFQLCVSALVAVGLRPEGLIAGPQAKPNPKSAELLEVLVRTYQQTQSGEASPLSLGEEGEDFDGLLAGQLRHPNPQADVDLSHGHSHGGVPCVGNHGHSHGAPHTSHGHSHGKRPQPGHGHSHGGVPCDGNHDQSEHAPQPGHGHSHGDKACSHDHGSATHGHSNASDLAACGNCGLTCEKLMKCSRCHKVAYCSKDCQVGHWKAGHKKKCGK